MRFIILGGGCYGTFYARQLLKAQQAGALSSAEILIVDSSGQPAAATQPDIAQHATMIQQTWDDFFDEFLEHAHADSPDLFVPSPFNPHLGLGWLLRSLQREFPDWPWALEPFSCLPGTPFQEQRGHGTLVASHADWICPVHCIEPETCPKTRGPRHWDMDRTARQHAAELTARGQPVDQVHLFHCHHVRYGVGGYPVAELVVARHALGRSLAAHREVRALVGTISRCHGAFHLLATHTGMDTVSPTAATPVRFPHNGTGDWR